MRSSYCSVIKTFASNVVNTHCGYCPTVACWGVVLLDAILQILTTHHFISSQCPIEYSLSILICSILRMENKYSYYLFYSST